jgi:hypothetical protein
MLTKKSPKSPKIFNCEKCDYTCFKQSEWNKHILTQKHSMLTNTDIETQKTKIFTCDCGKDYKHRQSLFKHKIFCNQKEIKPEADKITEIGNNITPELIIEIIKQNQEFKYMLIEQSKQNNEVNKQNKELQKQMIELSKNVGNNNNNITNKNKFNLNFFLNETCKDAMNLTDFVNSIKLQLQDLENVGKNGYVSGISNIIVKNLNALEVNKRPLHCSDLKREIMYVKDENKWEKEKNEKQKLTKAINKVSYKNVLQIQKWQKENPGCEYSHNKKNDEYLQIVNESMGAFTPEENTENINKIIKNVAKEVMIEKEAE